MPEKNLKNNQQVIILIGAPGAGKGTQAGLLSEKLNLYHFETSKILEAAFRNVSQRRFVSANGEKYDLLEEKKKWETGILCTPSLVSYLVKEKVVELHEDNKSIIFSGSPRTIDEGKTLIPFLKKLYGSKNIKVIFLEITAKETIWRNSRRRICELMRHPILYSKENEALRFCPLDGSKLLNRKGLDDPETIKIRIKEYQERTYPLVDLFNKQGLSLSRIDGKNSVAKVFADVLKALGEE
ncbi:MAG: nucleoside monophosphate kinase [bacterium]